MASCGTFFQELLELFFKSDSKQLPSLRKLNDCVYEFYSPPDGTSLSMERLERGDYSKAYVDTWTSFLDSTFICWPQSLLAEEFRRARILSVSYDSSIEKGPEQGNLDLYLTAENLVQDLIDHANVAANPGFPVVLVGKDLGGLVIKAICMEARAQNRYTFLSNLKGIFYYRTPHLGIENLPTAFNGALAERLAFGNNEIARLGSNFSNYRRNKWATRAIISLQRSKKVPEFAISEASQRYDVDEYYTPKENIDTVCKYQTQTSSSFKFLTGFISRIERGELCFESSPDQGQTKEGAGFRTSLGFEYDGNYVPMQTTLAEVRNALQSARIVVLHGDSGSGKSSLARYLALEFEVVAQQQGTSNLDDQHLGVVATSSAEQSYWLPSGVVYMTCGSGAEIVSMQRELLRKFDIDVSLLQDKSIALEGVQLQKMLHQKLVDNLSKLKFRVIVVLDDVWDDHLVENLLVPGDWVRYLLTTQIPTLWNAHDLKRVTMQDVTLKDARQILGNYVNFKSGVIPKDLENLADEIIVTTGFHPLALATLGVILNNMERSVEDWQELKDNLNEHLKTEDYRPSSFGQKYPLSVKASMMLVFDLLDEDAKKLLYKISLFDGPFIPETLLRLFLIYTRPRDEKVNISKPKMSLVAKGLVRIMTSTITTSTFADFDMRVIWIHSLRQHFVLTSKTEEIHQTTDFLDDDNYHKFLHRGEVLNLDLATALCALYGAADIKKRAMQRMGFHLIWSEKYSHGLAAAFKPFLSLMLSEGDTKNPISQAAAEVFLKYVREHKLDGDKISYLLRLSDYPSAPLATLAALAGIFSIEEVKLIDEDHLSFLNVVVSHVDSHDDLCRRTQVQCPSEAPLIKEYATKALFYICDKAAKEKSSTLVINFPNVLTVLVGLIQDALAEPTHQYSVDAWSAAAILGNLARGESNDSRWKICDAEGALAALGQSLFADDSHSLQQTAAMAFAFLAEGDMDLKLKICNAEGVLSGLVHSLSAHYNHPVHEWAARALAHLADGDVDIKTKICNAEGLLSGLVQSLSAHYNHPLQKWAAWALQRLARGDVDIKTKICNAKGLLSGLVRSLSAHDNHPLQEWAAWALANLAEGDLDTKMNICNEEGALSGLVRSLSVHDNHPLQEGAAWALANLAEGDVDTKMNICNEEGALSGLVRSLSAHDNHPLQKWAAWALVYLAEGDVDIKLKICNAEGVLSGLVHTLSAHYNHLLQEWAACALERLAEGDVDIKTKMCNAEGLLSGLVQSLSAHDNHPLQEAAAGALGQLARGDVDTRMNICNEEGALSGLVRSLSECDNHPLQDWAAWALNSLAMVAGESIKSKIAEEEGAVACLVICSEHENPESRQSAARLLNKFFRFTCDSCEFRIVGTRFNSSKKNDYDLCSDCFGKAPDQADYTQIN